MILRPFILHSVLTMIFIGGREGERGFSGKSNLLNRPAGTSGTRVRNVSHCLFGNF